MIPVAPPDQLVAPRRAQLLYRDPDGRDCSVELRPGGSFLGTASECLLRTDDSQVSPVHAFVSWTGEDWIVCDQESLNGTFRNDERLVGRRVLKQGDIIRCGSLQARYFEVSAAQDPLLGKTISGRYLIQQRLGEGALCVVYQATQLDLGSAVALKILAAQAAAEAQWVSRFRAAAQAVARLKHPGSVRVFDTGTSHEGLHYIILEYLDGRNLRSDLNRVGRLPAEQALRILIGACWPLVEAHAQGIVHCELAPENIMLCPAAGHGDFVRLIYPTGMEWPENPMMRKPGVVFGVPAYMSPEQVRGTAVDARADVYALGVVLYEMLTGMAPFTGHVPAEVALHHLRTPPPPMENVAESAARVALRALAKDPALRPASCTELAHACGEALGELAPKSS